MCDIYIYVKRCRVAKNPANRNSVDNEKSEWEEGKDVNRNHDAARTAKIVSG